MPTTRERGDRYHQEQRANNVNVTASRHFNGQQWVPCERQHQVRLLPATTQDIEQYENNCELANHKCYFQCEGRFVNGGYGAEEKMRSCWVLGWWSRGVQVAGFWGVGAPY